MLARLFSYNTSAGRTRAGLSLLILAAGLSAGCDVSGPILVNNGSDRWQCACLCGNASVSKQEVVEVCADDDFEALEACNEGCLAIGTCIFTGTKAKLDENYCPATGGEPYSLSGGVPNSSEASFGSGNFATVTYLGQPSMTVDVVGDVSFTGGCETGTCPIVFNRMYFATDDFSVTAPDNTTISVSDVFILNNGLIAGTQTNSDFTIPSSQVSLIVNGYANAAQYSLVFFPDPSQGVSGFYEPSSGKFNLSAHFFQGGGLLDLEFELEGEATSRPPVANAGPPQTVFADPVTETAEVTLDGSGSSDLDNDLEKIHWYEGTTYLGSGTDLEVEFGVGTHTVTAVAIDATDKYHTADTTVTVTRQ